MTFLAFSGISTAVFCTGLGVFVYLKKRTDPKNQAYCYLNSSIGFFGLFYYLWQQSASYVEAFYWFKIIVVGIILINVYTGRRPAGKG